MGSDWDKVYTERMMTLWEPQQSIVQFTARYLKRRIGYDEYETKKDGNSSAFLGRLLSRCSARRILA
jgi:hypothetical protein